MCDLDAFINWAFSLVWGRIYRTYFLGGKVFRAGDISRRANIISCREIIFADTDLARAQNIVRKIAQMDTLGILAAVVFLSAYCCLHRVFSL